LVEHFHGKEGVTGSSPVEGSIEKPRSRGAFLVRGRCSARNRGAVGNARGFPYALLSRGSARRAGCSASGCTSWTSPPRSWPSRSGWPPLSARARRRCCRRCSSPPPSAD